MTGTLLLVTLTCVGDRVIGDVHHCGDREHVDFAGLDRLIDGDVVVDRIAGPEAGADRCVVAVGPCLRRV